MEDKPDCPASPGSPPVSVLIKHMSGLLFRRWDPNSDPVAKAAATSAHRAISPACYQILESEIIPLTKNTHIKSSFPCPSYLANAPISAREDCRTMQTLPGMVAWVCNVSAWEEEAGISHVQGQSVPLHGRIQVLCI